MAIIKSSITIDSTQSLVWKIISDLDAEPKFWKGTKSIKNKSKNGNIIVRDITLAFRDKICEQKVTLEPESRIRAEFTQGIIKGSKLVELGLQDGKVSLDVTWDIAMTGLMGMFTSMISGHIKSGTEMALAAIKSEAESM